MEKIKLVDICNPKQWKTIPTGDLMEEGYPVYGANGVIGYYDEYNHENPVVAITCRGATCGSINITEPKAYVTGNAMCLDDLRSDIDIEYLYYFLKNYDFKGVISGSAQPQITRQGLEKVTLLLCSPEEQRYIVDKLKRIEAIIKLREEELDKLDELIKARFVELFGNINEDRFPKCKLRDVAHIKHGYAFSGEYFSDDDNGVVLVTPGNFALGGGFQEVHNRYFTAEYPDEYVLHAGDLIVTMTDLSKKADTLGYGAIVPDNDKVYLHNQRIGLFDKLDNTLNPVFVRWFMQTDEYRLEIVRTSTGSTVHHTSPDRILDSVIYLPPIEMQNKFVSFVKQVDKSKFEYQTKYEL